MTDQKQSPPEAPAGQLPTGQDGHSPLAPGAAAAARQPAGGSPAAGEGRLVYRAGGGRKFLFSVVFLLLLPFFASLPAMLYQRLSAGLWYDTIGLAVLAAGFTAVMLLVVFELIFSLRARIELGQAGLRFTLPAARAGMPKFFYRRREVPYSSIAAVETRREIYGGSLAPVLLHGTRIVTQDGEKIPLGYVNEANPDSLFPFADIAREIAARAGVEVIHRGNVRRQVHRKWLGLKAADEHQAPVPEAEFAALNARHGRALLVLCSALALLIAAGLAQDFLTASVDTGERGAEITSTKPSSEAQKAKPAPAKKS
jgi:hypothetical protein